MRREPDLQMTLGGTWEPYDAVAGGLTSAGPNGALHSLGWQPFWRMGDPEQMVVEVWTRSDDGPGEYLLDVAFGSQSSRCYMRVPNLPSLMTLLASWAPLIDAASAERLVDISGHRMLATIGDR